MAEDGNTEAEVSQAMRDVFGKLAALEAKECRCYFDDALGRGRGRERGRGGGEGGEARMFQGLVR